MHQEILRRKQNWVDFSDPTSSVTRLLTINYSESMPTRPLLWWENSKERMEWAYERYCRQMEGLDWLSDNTIPSLSMITGTEIFAEAFGCKVHKPLDNNPFALPLINSAKEVHRIKVPRLEDTPLINLFEMADQLRERAGKEALLSLLDVQTPIDIAALIWEKSDFYAAMYEEPEAVLELSGKIKELLFAFFDRWFARYGKEFIAHYPDYYMPTGISMSEDEIGAVSSSMYHTFFESELNEFSDRYGGIGIHCCADSKHQWQNLGRIRGLKILNLCRDEVQTLESLTCFRDICGQYPSTFPHNLDTIPDAEQLHFAHYLHVETKQEAKKIADHFQQTGYLR